MEDMEILSSIYPDYHTAEQKRKALRVVNLIKLKRRGKLKGSMCANGEPQRKFVMREESKFPTITLEGILSTMVIDEYYDRKVATFELPRAYLRTDLPKKRFTLLVLEVNVFNILCDINPEYKQHIRFKYGLKTLYIGILKYIYGMIESALLWYELYLSVFKDMGFQLNIYNVCVTNNYINRKHCNIVWYVDDNKISHVEQDVIHYVISNVEERFQ